jgi:hypothetical protein
MDQRLRDDILKRLQADFKFRHQGGQRWSGGHCPWCPDGRGRELYVYTENPWTVSCGRENKCGERRSVKDIYPDLFDNWTDRHQQTPENPHAAATAYLRDGRQLDLKPLHGIYTQELYQGYESKQTSATVRFPMPYGVDAKTAAPRQGFWERIIDRPARFGKKKANMPVGWRYGGYVWHHPAHGLEHLAKATEIWFAEGIFDALSLNQAFALHRPHAVAVSTLSTNNYPKHFLTALADHCAVNRLTKPTLIWAFDVGPAGVKYTRDYVKKSRGADEKYPEWVTGAAQVRPDGEGDKHDWNDLLGQNRLTADNLDAYIENGAITIAVNVSEKAWLIWKRTKQAEFALTFETQTYWARFPAAEINQLLEQWREEGQFDDLTDEEKAHEAARVCCQVSDIANCVFRTLYFERREQDAEGSYYLRINLPGKNNEVRASFAGAAVGAAGDFKKRMLGVAGGAMFTGSNFQLEKMMKLQLKNIRTVIALDFRGYSIQHKAWLFDKIAVTAGRIIELNDQDYFEIGQTGLKLPRANGADSSTDRFDITVAMPDGRRWGWWRDFYAAFGTLGLVALSYWFLSLFAEQVRAEWQDLGFLEITGEPGSGKSTLIIFLWKLVGRLGNYEGFDPAKTTVAGLSRELVKVGNLPVVLIEGDRNTDQPQMRRFDWDELKPLYNGNPPRTRGVANGGTDTYAPRFRGSIVIAQNHMITGAEADRAVLERIVHMTMDKDRFNEPGREAGARLQKLEVPDLSHWLVAMTKAEGKVLELFNRRFPNHFKRLLDDEHVTVDRLARTHAQVATALECLIETMRDERGHTVIQPEQARAAHDLITSMCRERHGVLDADHPMIKRFWENYDYIDTKMLDAHTFGLNMSRKPRQFIALHFPTFEQKSADYRLALTPDIQKLLPQSKSRKFIGQRQTNCIDGKARHCWMFHNGPAEVNEREVGFV